MVRNSWGNAAKKTARCPQCGFEHPTIKREYRRFQANGWGIGPITYTCPICRATLRYPRGLAEPTAPEAEETWR